MSPAPPPKPPDRHYDFGKMNQVFAWSAAALFVITVLMVFFDYRQPWKRFQSEFRDLERQKLAKEAEAERQRINQQEITQLRADIAAEGQALAQHGQEIGKLEKDLEGFAAKVYAADAAYRQTKSLLDTARFHYEDAVQGGDTARIAGAKQDVEELSAKLREQKKALEEFSGQRDGVTAELDGRRAKRKQSEDRLAALEKGVDTAEKRIATLSKNIDYFLLNAPLMDFLAPSLKVEQVMLPGLFHDINFHQNRPRRPLHDLSPGGAPHRFRGCRLERAAALPSATRPLSSATPRPILTAASAAPFATAAWTAPPSSRAPATARPRPSSKPSGRRPTAGRCSNSSTPRSFPRAWPIPAASPVTPARCGRRRAKCRKPAAS